ncbi:MAG: hypothetical protein ACRERC_15890 [Candidatus Binatia bacterium]
MHPTYFDIEMLSARAAAEAVDRPAEMPLLGLLTGMGLALCLWSAIAALVWALVA